MKVEIRDVTKGLLTVVWAVAALTIVSLFVRFPADFSGSKSFQELLAATTRDPVALLIIIPIASVIVACILATIGRRWAGVHVMLFAVITSLPMAVLLTVGAAWVFLIVALFGGYPGAASPDGPPRSILEFQLMLLGNYITVSHLALGAYLFWVAFVVTICETRRLHARVNATL